MAASSAAMQAAQNSHNAKLQDEAAAAALYTKQEPASTKSHEYLDRDHRLSSAGAAASLKYARPEDLPSHPITGLKKNASNAGAAATLGWANQKSFEHWKPDPSASASAAAMSAKDYKMKELWQPEQSAHGAKAALAAHKDGGKVEIWQPDADSPWGNSAATQAFKKFGAGTLSPVLDYGYTTVGRQGSVKAATGAMSQSRQRALSNPVPAPKRETYPDEFNAATNAISAATSAQRPKKRSDLAENGAVPYTTMDSEMYTANPPVAPELEEKARADTLRASAVAMAKAMYNVQQKQQESDEAQRAASSAHGRKSTLSDYSDEPEPMRFNKLQEAAQKLAHERLSKLHDEHAQNREYRDYYGESPQPPASRLSIRGRTRRRASSDGGMDDDKAQSNKIRAQMSLFSSNLSQVDGKKRQADRDNLIAIAQRNVTKSLHGMDERVFAETGKVAPSLLSEWELKAHAAAQAKSDTRMENYGKVHIGGGKYIDQSEIDAVARGNVQPVLDEISEKAAAEHERQAAFKAEQLETARKAAERKQREKETKAINKKLRQQDAEEEKLRIQEEKEEKKAAQRAEKERQAHEAAKVVPTETAAASAGAVDAVPMRTSMEDQASLRMQQLADSTNVGESTPMSPGTSDAKSKGRMSWLKTRFSRRLSRGQKSAPEKEAPSEEKSFVGGAALTGTGGDESTASIGGYNRDSIVSKPLDIETGDGAAETKFADAASTNEIREAEAVPPAETLATLDSANETRVPAFLPLGMETQDPVIPHNVEPDEMATSVVKEKEHEETSAAVDSTETETETEKPVEEPAKEADESNDPEVDSGAVLALQPTNEDEEFQEARDNFDEDLAPPPTFPAEKSHSPARETRFKEVID